MSVNDRQRPMFLERDASPAPFALSSVEEERTVDQQSIVIIDGLELTKS
jgi:hypothetical protein